MKRLERDILLRLREASKREPLETAISLHQCYGIDIIPFAINLAKVTLMLAKELDRIEARRLSEADQLLIEEKPLALANLDRNIICADALFTNWPAAEPIIGNPRYLRAQWMKPEHSAEYVEKLRKSYPEIPGRADYCVYWFETLTISSPTADGLVWLAPRTSATTGRESVDSTKTAAERAIRNTILLRGKSRRLSSRPITGGRAGLVSPTLLDFRFGFLIRCSMCSRLSSCVVPAP